MQNSVIMTWADLRAELKKLREFHASAVQCIDTLMLAADFEDNEMLREGLLRHSDLTPKVRPPFTVAKELWAGKRTLKLVQ